ncbi:MAG: hypothetical protein ABI578_05295, partial [Chloroflexota bacterium]
PPPPPPPPVLGAALAPPPVLAPALAPPPPPELAPGELEAGVLHATAIAEIATRASIGRR